MADNLTVSKDEIEYLILLRNRFKSLARIIFNEPFMDYEPDMRFYILKELYSIYNELFSMKQFVEIFPIIDDELLKQIAFQKDLIKMIRNVLLHFPFFSAWNEVYIKKSLVILNVKLKKGDVPISSIHDFFTNPINNGCYARITETNKVETTILMQVPKGYDNNEKIYLNRIIEEQYVGKFTVGYMMILFNNFVKTKKLYELIIPTEENQ